MNEFQTELFAEFEKGSKKRHEPKNQPVAKRYSLLLNISYEQLVFSLIALIMTMVLVFSLGVEKGKDLSKIEGVEDRITGDTSLAEVIVPVGGAGMEGPSMEEVSVPEEAKRPRSEKLPTPVEIALPPEPSEVSRPYTIQVATFWAKDRATQEVENLKIKGLDPFIMSANGKYEICVGKYINRADASGDIGKLKKSYKDCFLRRR